MRGGRKCAWRMGHKGNCLSEEAMKLRKERRRISDRRSYATNPKRRKDVTANSLAKVAGLRDRVSEIKLQLGCIDCGYRQHSVALDFDHKPGVEKVASVSFLVGRARPWGIIQTEIDKCDVRCANCHRVVTRQRQQEGSDGV